jgi:hypothetical protein
MLLPLVVMSGKEILNDSSAIGQYHASGICPATIVTWNFVAMMST